MKEITSENFDRFENWLTSVNEMRNKYLQENYPTLAPVSKLVSKVGKRYIKVIVNEYGDDRSVWAFIDKTNGDVLKPAGWNTPAKHARGNIFDEWNGLKYVDPYGPAYLR